MKIERICVVSMVFLSLFLSSNSAANARNQEGKQSRKIGVRTIRPVQMPVTINNLSARLIGKQTVLFYSITNRGIDQLEAVEISVIVYDRSGHIKGGEGWRQNIRISENSTESFPRILESQLSPGDRLIVAISRIVGESQTFELGEAEFIEAARARISGTQKTARPLEYRMAYSQQTGTETFCDKSQNQAEKACTCGIQSFSCDETEKNFSFTCFPRTNCIQE